MAKENNKTKQVKRVVQLKAGCGWFYFLDIPRYLIFLDILFTTTTWSSSILSIDQAPS